MLGPIPAGREAGKQENGRRRGARVDEERQAGRRADRDPVTT